MPEPLTSLHVIYSTVLAFCRFGAEFEAFSEPLDEYLGTNRGGIDTIGFTSVPTYSWTRFRD